MRSTFHSLVIRLALITSICIVAGSRHLNAALITDPQSFGAPPAVLSGDLLETSATITTQTGNFIHEGSDPPSILSDGAFPPFVGGSRAGVTTPDNNAFVVWTFDTSVNTQGYRITNIIMSGGWSDGGRNRQDWTVSYTVVGNPTLIPITTVSFEPSGNYSSFGLSDSLGFLATNVETLRVDFPNQENGYAGYGELDVLGVGLTPPVPEPGTLALLAIGLVSLRFARRRRRGATADRSRRG